jgi:FlaA1/EpsC-like NDP-sugar epimerase
VLIIGTGIKAEAAARYVTSRRNEGMKVAGLVDGDPFKFGRFMHGSCVVGAIEDLRGIYLTTRFNQILLACDQLPPEKMETLLAFARSRAVAVFDFAIRVNEIGYAPSGSATVIPLRKQAVPEKVVA